MLVRDRMTPNPITASPDTSLEDALRLMRERKIRRLPVVDKQGNLVGIVVEKDLLYASPSPATTLSVFELPYLLARIKMQELMAKRVLSVDEDCPLEEAARIMVDHKVGSLPVVRGKQLVGIITETDIFRVMTEALGGRVAGLRVSLRTADRPGALAALTGEITRLGGNIVSLVTFSPDEPAKHQITIKLQGVARSDLTAALQKAGAEIIDLREVGEAYEPRIISSR